MIKLPKDRWDNEGWVVKARKPHPCEVKNYGCAHWIESGEHYYRAIAFPGTDVNSGTAPWVMKMCRNCMPEDLRGEFDAIIAPVAEQVAWRDKHGDVWQYGDDGLLHTKETAPFTREHVEKKWGPLIPTRRLDGAETSVH